MKSISGRDLARLAERRGWRLLRVSGSHHIYGRPESPGSLTAFPITNWNERLILEPRAARLCLRWPRSRLIRRPSQRG